MSFSTFVVLEIAKMFFSSAVSWHEQITPLKTVAIYISEIIIQAMPNIYRNAMKQLLATLNVNQATIKARSLKLSAKVFLIVTQVD